MKQKTYLFLKRIFLLEMNINENELLNNLKPIIKSNSQYGKILYQIISKNIIYQKRI